jgi:dipeptidyl aminopeptidase/acylaminoacyl peptidase
MKILSQIYIIVVLCFSNQLYAGDDPSRYDFDDPVIDYYTVQIGLFPTEEDSIAQQLYETLKNKGYLVYKSRININRNPYTQIRIEFFKQYSDADEFAEKIKKTEGYDCYAAYANAIIENYKNQFSIINLPKLVIYKDSVKYYELYQGEYERKVYISPDGKMILFSDGRTKIMKINIKTKNLFVLKDADQHSYVLSNPEPNWSPDGKYIAFLKNHGFESPASLWIMDADGSNEKCIVPCCKIEKDHSVKSFQWHPSGKFIFFSNGYTMGTVSVGGDIYITDLYGNVNLIADADIKQRWEIFRGFRIVGDTLYYKVAHFDDNFEQREYILNKKFIGNFK